MNLQELHDAYEIQRQDIEQAYLKSEMTDKERAQLIEHASLEYRLAMLQGGHMDSAFQVTTLDEIAKNAELTRIEEQITTMPKPETSKFGLMESAKVFQPQES